MVRVFHKRLTLRFKSQNRISYLYKHIVIAITTTLYLGIGKDQLFSYGKALINVTSTKNNSKERPLGFSCVTLVSEY